MLVLTQNKKIIKIRLISLDLKDFDILVFGSSRPLGLVRPLFGLFNVSKIHNPVKK